MVARSTKGRGVDIAILAVYLGSLILMGGYVRSSHHDLVYSNCRAIENLKSGQREAAQKTIDAENKLLREHDQLGTPLPLGITRAQIVADRDAKQATVDRYPPRICRK